MAKQTPSALKTQADAAETHKVFHVIKEINGSGNNVHYYVVGITAPYNRAGWVTVDTSRTLAQQSQDILDGLKVMRG